MRQNHGIPLVRTTLTSMTFVSYKTKAQMQSITQILTNREADVLRLVVKGFSTIQIAESLSVSVNTIETHRKAIYRKMGVKRVGEAIRVAQEQGFF